MPRSIPKPLRGLLLVASLLALANAVPVARACTIPVFRYALERWPAERFELVVFRRGPLGAGERGMLDKLADRDALPANVELTEIDLSRKVAGEAAALWRRQAAAAAGGAEPQVPWAVLRHPEATDEASATLWAGPLDAKAVDKLLDSPARKHVAAQLLAGQSAVFVLIESGDRATDDAAAKLLRDELDRAQSKLKLPTIDPDDPGPRLLSELPLKLAFTVLRVSRSDPAERAFVDLLLFGQRQDLAVAARKKGPTTTTPTTPSSSGGAAAVEPVVVPVFGQGRALCTLAGSEIASAPIAEVASFLVGECSCQVKELNPGFDLLMTADWGSILDENGLARRDEPPARRGPGTQPSNIPEPVIGPGKKKQEK